MSDPTFMADPTRLVIAAIVGIALLLALIIKFKLHPVLSMMVSALAIGIGAGMPLDLVADTVTKGVGTTLQNIALLTSARRSRRHRKHAHPDGALDALDVASAPRRLTQSSSVETLRAKLLRSRTAVLRGRAKSTAPLSRPRERSSGLSASTVSCFCA